MDARMQRRKLKKAMAVAYSQNEANQIIAEKKKELIDDQMKYRRTVLTRVLRGHELAEMNVQIESGNIKMLWYGMPYPIEILKDSYNIGLEAYMDLIYEENKLREKLMKVHNLTEEQVNGIMENKIIKEPVMKDEAEQDTIAGDVLGRKEDLV